jgi:hypothetical protein
MKNFAMTPYPQSVVDCDPPFALPMVDELTRKQRERERESRRSPAKLGGRATRNDAEQLQPF